MRSQTSVLRESERVYESESEIIVLSLEMVRFSASGTRRECVYVAGSARGGE